jgi:signal peptidase
MRLHRWFWAPIAVLTVTLLVPVTVFVVWTTLSGYRLESVRSGSMQPTYQVGSLLVVAPVDPAAVRVGTALSFISPADGLLETHRVIEIVNNADGLAFRTRGDANRTPDKFIVPASAARGTVRWSVPRLGDLMRWFAWPRGFILLVVTPLVVLAVTEGVSRRRRGRPAPAGAAPLTIAAQRPSSDSHAQSSAGARRKGSVSR